MGLLQAKKKEEQESPLQRLKTIQTESKLGKIFQDHLVKTLKIEEELRLLETSGSPEDQEIESKVKEVKQMQNDFINSDNSSFLETILEYNCKESRQNDKIRKTKINKFQLQDKGE